MKSVPFKRLVQAYLFYGERLPRIMERLQGFEFECVESDLAYILDECRAPLPEVLSKKFVECQPFNPYTNEIEKQWLQQLGLYEFFDFIMRRKQEVADIPNYFKWFNDCLWILAHREVTCLVNILMFNGDELDSISDVISCKYKKKIGIDALERYRLFFWDTSAIDAKEALYFYAPFRKNALIMKYKPEATEAEISQCLSSDDGSTESIVFHDSNYIKWRVGYKKVTIPSAEDFLEQVKTDSIFKYYEAMNMVRSVEEHNENGFNDKIGQFNMDRKIRKNVEEQRIKAAKGWLDMFMRAHKGKKPDTPGDEDIFKKMSSLPMSFDSEKLLSVDDNPEMLDDIRKDM
jgi:hypothetical protein